MLTVGIAAEALACCQLETEATQLKCFLTQVSARYQEEENSCGISYRLVPISFQLATLLIWTYCLKLKIILKTLKS